MQYKQLGKSGLMVSQLALGTMTFGDGADAKESGKIFNAALDAGINHIDCANLYAHGKSEEILAPLIKARRQKIILSSKAYFATSTDPNDRGLSRHHLTQALDDSLRRLDTDYLDIYYLHRFDEKTSLEESLMTVDDFVRAGKVRYVGLSNFAAWQVMKALGVQAAFRLNRIVAIQPMYNLLKRQSEVEIMPMAIAEGLGVLPYSPLGAGLLTGKYIKMPDQGRLLTNTQYQRRYADPSHLRIVDDFVALAKKHKHDPASLAIAWVCAHPAVTAPIIGARTLTQFQLALAALDIPMTPELYDEIANLTPAVPLATDRAEEQFKE